MRSVAGLLLLLLAVAGCGGGGEDDAAVPTLAEARERLAGAPAPLAALHADANQVLPGGLDAVRRRLRDLRGHPVVLNKWASWCGPCRLEFPVFQRVSVALGRRVAFVGLDSRDEDPAARRYLAERPLSYPSYSDPEGEAAQALKTSIGVPITNFYDRTGKLVFQHAGPYRSDAQLERDVRRLLGA